MDYQCTQAEEIERNRVHEETMQMLREMIKIQEEKRIFEEAARQEEEKRIAKEKEAAELEAKRKSQECLNIEEKSIPQASIRSRKSRIDPTLSNFTVSTKRIPLSDFIPPVTPNVKTVNSLKMGDKHLDTQKGSLESSVKDPIPIPISAIGGKKETAVKPSAGCNWRPKTHYWHKVSKYNGGSSSRDYDTFQDPLGRPKVKKSLGPKEKLITYIQCLQEANQNAGTEDNIDAVDKEDQVFFDELERLKRQEQDANDAVEALRKEFAQETKDLLLQSGAAKASSTNIVNTASTLVSTASPYGGLSFTDLTNTDQDDSEIHALEEIYDNPTNGIFTNSSYDDEGAVADFTNLEPVVN
ncbi:hypothetical protein Tco_0917236, partial [Tanacetum coccineum]